MHKVETETETGRKSARDVSPTWKWLAVTVISVLIASGAYDRLSVDNRISRLENDVKYAPTKQDVRDLQQSMEKLSDKIDNLRDRINRP